MKTKPGHLEKVKASEVCQVNLCDTQVCPKQIETDWKSRNYHLTWIILSPHPHPNTHNDPWPKGNSVQGKALDLDKFLALVPLLLAREWPVIEPLWAFWVIICKTGLIYHLKELWGYSEMMNRKYISYCFFHKATCLRCHINYVN